MRIPVKFFPMAVCVVLLTISATIVRAQSTEFTFQGKLNDGANPANANYDFEFLLYDSLSGGIQIGGTLSRPGIAVTGGIFSVRLDFGNAFPGSDRYLEIRVKAGGSPGGFTILAPRQRVASSPYSVQSLNAATAANSTQLGGVAANQYVLTGDARLSDARPPTAGSTNYVQNTVSQQAATNFNISGNGTVGGTLTGNSVNSATQYDLAGGRFLKGDNVTGNLFVGPGTGSALTTGLSNTFVGASAGLATNASSGNSFFGAVAGLSNTSGFGNSFFGSDAGRSNTTGSANAFFGYHAGEFSTGSGNTFFGSGAGAKNQAAISNAFFGASAGGNNLGESNSFFGRESGFANTNGGANAFFGRNAGDTNTTGSFNTALGFNADVTDPALQYATAIGADSVVSTINTIALGRSSGLDKVVIYGLGTAGATALCRNASNQISTCSSSLRYKTNIASFGFGLDLINRLKPITFDWKDGGMHDLGLGAEEVAEIEPLLVNFNEKGEVEGVKYDRIGVVLINAVKEQQALIEQQQKKIEGLQKSVDALTAYICSQNAALANCRAASGEDPK